MNMELRGMIRNTLPNRQQTKVKRGTGNLEIINTSYIWVLKTTVNAPISRGILKNKTIQIQIELLISPQAF